MGSTWYTSDFHIFTIGIYTFKPWHQGWYHGQKNTVSIFRRQDVTDFFTSVSASSRLWARCLLGFNRNGNYRARDGYCR